MKVDDVVDTGIPLAKGAQILLLVKDNQLVTAAILFILWQAGAISQGLGIVGGFC